MGDTLPQYQGRVGILRELREDLECKARYTQDLDVLSGIEAAIEAVDVYIARENEAAEPRQDVYGVCACCGGLNTLSPEWCWINRHGNPVDPDRENVTDTHVCDDCDDVVGIEWVYASGDGFEWSDQRFASIEDAQAAIRARARAGEVDHG